MMSKEQLNAGPLSPIFHGAELVLNSGVEVDIESISSDVDCHITVVGQFFTKEDLRELADYLNALATWIEKGGR